MTVQAQGRNWCKGQFRCTWGRTERGKDSSGAETTSRKQRLSGPNVATGGARLGYWEPAGPPRTGYAKVRVEARGLEARRGWLG